MKRGIPSYPLITCDPFFSVWSPYDAPYEGETVHWSGEAMPLRLVVRAGGQCWRLLGKDSFTEAMPALPLVASRVTPLMTEYTFSGSGISFVLSFMTPTLLDDTATVTLPVSYVSYTAECSAKDFTVYFSVSPLLAATSDTGAMVFSAERGSVCAGAAEQRPAEKGGDRVAAGWGYVYLAHRFARLTEPGLSSFAVCGRLKAAQPGIYAKSPDMPVLTAVSYDREDNFTVAYDDVVPLVYLGEPAEAYWRKTYKSFADMLAAEAARFDEYTLRAGRFGKRLLSEANRISPEYAHIISLAYRQATAAHKLVTWHGETMFVSKECSSNGCAATLDVTYPSIPLYLKYNPPLVRAMLRPLFGFAESDMWRFDFAPHDCGRYPLLNRQVYGLSGDGYDPAMQMPVEECGNALICASLAELADGDRAFNRRYALLLGKYADYLTEHGYNPEDQLCTDDFAGHTRGNCNLSVKSAVALRCWGRVTESEKYSSAGSLMAQRWAEETRSDESTPLEFGGGGWSLKYNMVWDRVLGLGLFPDSVYDGEARRYRREMRKYGTPLDGRRDYTKLDWQVWTAVMCGGAYGREAYRRICAMLADTPDRVPMTDWYDTVTAKECGFRARSVVGAVFMPIMALNRKRRKIK